MRQIKLAFLIALAVITGCRTLSTPPSPEQNIFVNVECRNEPSTRNWVLQLLRTPNARDLAIREDESFLNIEVMLVEVTRDSWNKIEKLESELKVIPGVVFVDIRRPIREVREIFRSGRNF